VKTIVTIFLLSDTARVYDPSGGLPIVGASWPSP